VGKNLADILYPKLEQMFWYNGSSQNRLVKLTAAMSIIVRLLRNLTRPFASRRTFAFDETLVQSLRSLAEHEQRSASDLAGDLLASALAQHHTREELWQRWQSLSPREQEVTALTCLDYTNRQIAARLGISAETVKTHVRNILVKFNLHSKSELRLVLSGWDFSDWDRDSHRSAF
jgi:DNA-binding CsgD family transcriptional regulator